MLKALCYCLCCFGYSQNYVDVVKASYELSTPNNFENSKEQTKINKWALKLNYPHVIDTKNILLTNIFSNSVRLDLNPNSSSTNLNVLGLQLGLRREFSKTWSGLFLLVPKIASDRFSFSKTNQQLGFISLWTQKKNKNLKYRYGLYVNTEKYGVLILPIWGLYYVHPNKKIEVNLKLPILADVNWKMSRSVWLGAKIKSLVTSYSLANQNNYVANNSNKLMGYARFKLNKSIYLNTNLGYSIVRNYSVYSNAHEKNISLGSFYLGKERKELNSTLEKGLFFKTELLYRFDF